MSRPCEEIDERVTTFLDRPIEGDWTYLWIYATYVKVRQNGPIVSVAVIVAVGVSSDGLREVLGMDIGASEAEPFWMALLRKLVCPGQRGVKLVISDSQEDINATAAKFAALTNDAEPDVLTYMTCPREHRAKLYGTNPIKRLNGEIKRRTGVVGIFPNEAAITRLVSAILMEQSDEWAIQRARYMTLGTMAPLSDNPIIMLLAVPGI